MRGTRRNTRFTAACVIAQDMIGNISHDAITVGARTANDVLARRKTLESRTNRRLAICIVQVAVFK